jgi:hypothetical protein
MANPNIISASTIYGKWAGLNVATTSATVLLTNTVNSGVLLKLVSVTAANKTMTNATITLAVETPAASPTTIYAVQSNVGLPARATLVLVSKDVPIYLTENSRITVTVNIANAVDIVCSYEEIA